MRWVAIALSLFLPLPSLAADIFESPNAGYSLIYSEDWQPEESGSPDDIRLKCIYRYCEGSVVATVLAARDYRYANDTPDRLFRRIHPERFIEMVKANASRLGRVKELNYPVQARIGNTVGFIGNFRITYQDGRNRHMVYGLVLNKGYFYHIQFLTRLAPNEQLTPLLNALLDGFQVNQSE